MSIIPESHLDLLKRPLFGHLATIRPDGSPQVNPMWFRWDGEFLRFTSTTIRRKYRNVRRDPRVALSVNDPDQPYRYLEVRGLVDRIEPDQGCEFFTGLAARYGMTYDSPKPDAEFRVVLIVRPITSSLQ